MLLAFEMKKEFEMNKADGGGKDINETTLVIEDSLMKTNISQSRLFIDSR
jgi:hypothetical protein